MSEVAVASQGAFGISPQQWDISDATSKGIALPGSPTWHWYPATRVGFGLTQIQGQLPPAIAGSILPRGAFKDGVFAGGMIELVPSLENDFGMLLQAMSGVFNYGVIADQRLAATHGAYPNLASESGTNIHAWVPDADRSRLGYLTARKLLPSPVASKTLGETVTDVRTTGMVLNLPNSGVVTAQVGFAGITPAFDDDPGWVSSYDEDYMAVVSSLNSFISFEVGGSFIAAPCVGATLTLDNGVVPAAQMRKIGSPYAFDLPAFGPRVASIRAVIMIDTTTSAGYELYTQLMTHEALASAATWSPEPYKADVHLRVASPFYVNATNSTPYAFEFLTIGGNCTYSLVDNLPLVAGGGVAMTVDMIPQEINTTSLSDTATDGDTTTVTKTAAGWTEHQYVGFKIKITSGNAEGDERIITANGTQTLEVDGDHPFTAAISTSQFDLYAPPWVARLQNGVASYDWPSTA